MSEGLTYNYKAKTVVRIGDVVMAPGAMRGIVIGIQGTFVKVLGIGTRRVAQPGWIGIGRRCGFDAKEKIGPLRSG